LKINFNLNNLFTKFTRGEEDFFEKKVQFRYRFSAHLLNMELVETDDFIYNFVK